MKTKWQLHVNLSCYTETMIGQILNSFLRTHWRAKYSHERVTYTGWWKDRDSLLNSSALSGRVGGKEGGDRENPAVLSVHHTPALSLPLCPKEGGKGNMPHKWHFHLSFLLVASRLPSACRDSEGQEKMDEEID